jgi:putative transposase
MHKVRRREGPRPDPPNVISIRTPGVLSVRRAYKFRAYLTRPQEGRATRLLADHCELYNTALEERREAWRTHKASISYSMQSAQLKEIRHADRNGQGRHSFTAQQQTLRRLSTVFQGFYHRCVAGQKPGYPRFKPRSRFDQVMFVVGDGAKWNHAPGGNRWAGASFRAVGTVKVRQHRPVRGTVKTLQLKRECRRWYVIVVADGARILVGKAHGPMDADVNGARNVYTRAGLGSGQAAPAA